MVHDFAGAKPTGYAGPNLTSGLRLAQTVADLVMTPPPEPLRHPPQGQDGALGAPIVDFFHTASVPRDPPYGP
ncbi:hypothetical protein EVAR_103870_1 [Eumeta japonica]|uniref:Uncharacterized protein n=1 Tax=Eumeta variegata TaxID=151549 RepID=A0A4C1SA68_EUMVA|nr:hypothetical protein EVAR_103870_1 [Eumeta japonica]